MSDMKYEKKYKEAMDRMELCVRSGLKITPEYIFPELAENKAERIRKALLDAMNDYTPDSIIWDDIRAGEIAAWLEKQGEPTDKGEISDGYHTFNELYYYRMLYNAAFFNMLPKEWVHKSKKHHDGEECFGGGWFIVMANLPTGQISNHYELKDWNLFRIPEKEVADKWDGHTPQEAADRLYKYLLEKQGEQKSAEWSEEDEQHIDSLLKRLDALCRNKIERTRFAISEDRDWLKSLRPLKRWKPSDEQMKLLSEVQSALLGKDCHNRFTCFMWELKKLKDK